jgi:hypothetical protein
MSDRETFVLLSTLAKSPAYAKLMQLWILDVTEIEAKRDSVAQKTNSELSWKYHAGLEKGFKKAMMRLSEELASMEEEGGNVMDQPSEKIERLLSEARGEKI